MELSGGGGLLYSTLGSDPELRDLVALFVAEMPGRIAALLGQLQARDWDSLRGTAHQLKGAAGSYGFAPLSPYAGAVEGAVCQQEPEEEIRAAVGALVEMCRRTRAGTPPEWIVDNGY